MYCSSCGAKINDRAIVCIKCGCAVNGTSHVSRQVDERNEWLTVALLCFFLGCFGVHSFYAKKNDTGIMQLLLGLLSCFVLSWVWALVDFVQIMCGTYNTGDGRVLKNG
ncbi:MAG: TM2 domain-containing protein [Kiritimatiellae bacterium]|nr:TM2 domain-containing protein [Kiritimatiellia bacterium]